MKELIQFFEKDIRREGFSRREVIVYGVFYPSGIVAACIIGEIINGL